MSDTSARRGARLVGILGLLIVLGAGCWRSSGQHSSTAAVADQNLAEQVHQFCGACHAYPPPDTVPRALWKGEVERGYSFFRQARLPLTPPLDTPFLRPYHGIQWLETRGRFPFEHHSLSPMHRVYRAVAS